MGGWAGIAQMATCRQLGLIRGFICNQIPFRPISGGLERVRDIKSCVIRPGSRSLGATRNAALERTKFWPGNHMTCLSA